MIRFIIKEDFSQIKQIWQVCFGDDESYVRLFWDNGFPLCRGLAREEDGALVSMLFLLPGFLTDAAARIRAEYVYAVATLPEHRGKGHAAELIRHAAEIAQKDGLSALCLMPAEESLCDYYQKTGFVKAFARRIYTYVREDINAPYVPTNAPWNAQKIAKQRDNRLQGLGYFEWTPRLLDYMRAEEMFRGGKVRISDRGHLFYHAEDGILQVDECCASAEETRWLLQKALLMSECKQAAARLPVDFDDPNTLAETTGMLLPLNDDANQWLARTQGKAFLGLSLE
ncbi:MAG: GNAT family N-acetyltransferase [Oscillospiraceae bacterium]|jgi:GNAT superfamily N-acetyltransferase|nr:GNAT family N-acetyltransferase [Oscillospiraceae bacterium]